MATAEQLLEAKNAAIAAFKSCEAYQFNLVMAWRNDRTASDIDDLPDYVESQSAALERVRDRLIAALTPDVRLAIEKAAAAELPATTIYNETYATAHVAAIRCQNVFAGPASIYEPTLMEPREGWATGACEGVRAIQIPDVGELVARVTKEWALAMAAIGEAGIIGGVNPSDAEKDILAIVQAAGEPLSTADIFQVLSENGKIPSEGTTKTALAAMKRHGLLASGPNGKGYQMGWLGRYITVGD